MTQEYLAQQPLLLQMWSDFWMRRLCLLLFFFFNISTLYPLNVAIDFRGADFNEITNVVEKIYSSNLKIYFSIVDNPFRKQLDGSIYDFEIPNKEAFSNILSFFLEKGIDVYIYLSLFAQPRYFSRKLWSIEDFTFDSINYSSNYIVDIDTKRTRSKLKDYFSKLKNLSKRWVIDLSELPEYEVKKFLEFSLSEVGESMFLSSRSFKNFEKKVIQSEDYWNLRKNNFLYPIANFNGLENFLSKGGINFIESDENSLNNVATLIFLLLKGESVLIPYKLISEFFLGLWSFIEGGDFKNVYLSKERMFFAEKDKVLVINFAGCYEAVELDNIGFSDKFFGFSKGGGGWMKTEKGKTTFFLFPGTISYYERLREKK